ncbi:MarR family transcriptional regulator [Xanthobacter autotrophicus DSM 431]|uniref:MarR family winged helix-turn-helix transcriptional regulator n=1 Tax=Xanthobacter nonsaccharivorans TaxID=3119912 RepID=UPI003726403B
MPSAPSPSAAARFGFHLVGLARRWRRHLDEELAAAGLSDATWTPLVHLHAAGGALHQKDLAARVGLDGSSLVRLVDILERQGLVTRLVDAHDRRARQVELTPAGLSAVKVIRRRIVAIERRLLEGIGDAEMETALAVFARIDDRIAALHAAKGR